MKPENLKKLLHNRNKGKKEKPNKSPHFSEDKLSISYIKINDLKDTKKAVAFNMLRNRTIDQQLNKYLHPNSVHIRLKPYCDAKTWIHWIGILGDVTLPNSTNLNGSLLIDKISCYPNTEILDYHAWLNIDHIKYIGHQTQQLAIGDYIEGYSLVKQYGQGKYGLDATFIKGAGMFIGTNKPETLVSGYDRQDSWVVELSNNNLTKKNYENNYQTNDIEEFAATGAHVDARFQPSRYKKFQQRLEKMQQGESDDVLPLVDKNKKIYLATVVRSHAVEVQSVSHKMPQLEVKNVVVKDSGRLVFAKYYLPYVNEIKVLGELKPGDVIQFVSEASPSKTGIFDKVTDFKLLTEHDFTQLPNNPNAFLGYIMWRHPEEGESSYIASYQNWALAKQIHKEEILSEIDSTRPTSDLSELELANSLRINKKWVENARKQGVIRPIEDTGLTRRYGSENWNILRQIIGAQDRYTVEHLKQFLPIYTTEDLIEKTGIDRSEVETRLKQEEFFPLNGLHCAINLYGPKVLNLFKARKSVQDLLPNKNTVIKKREIPVDKKMVIPEDETPAEPPKTDEEKPKDIKVKIIKKAEPVDEPKKQPVEKAEPKPEIKKPVEKAEPKPIAKPEEKAPTVPKKKEEQPQPRKEPTPSLAILITTFDETEYKYPTADPKSEIAEIVKFAEKATINKILPVTNVSTGEQEFISVKSIMKIKQK